MPRNFGKEARGGRARELSLLIAIVCGLLISRLATLQLVDGKYYRSLSEENRIRAEEVRAQRGRILDRNGEVLADNYPSYRLTLDPDQQTLAKDPSTLEAVLEQLAVLLESDPDRLRDRLSKRDRRRPAVLSRSLRFEQVSRIEERLDRLPGVHVEVVTVRRYPNGSLACHLLGYLGEVQPRDLQSDAEGIYQIGHLIGRTGIEQQYEVELRGRDGKAYVEVDVHGRRTSYFPELPSIPAISGQDIILTIDAELQAVAERSLAEIVPHGGLHGHENDPAPPSSLVALDAKTGEVLALVSYPGYDPNIFIGGLSQTEYQTLLGPGKPQHNRAINSTYPPASTYKPVTSLAGLESGKITAFTEFDPCYGSYQYGNRRFRCWKRVGHGNAAHDSALRRSCDVYYYQLGIQLGVEALGKYGQRFRLHERTGIDLPGERRNLIPTPEWYREKRGGFGGGVALNLSIGQGEILMSPIALARFYVAIATGQIVQPHLLRQVRDARGEVVRDTAQESWVVAPLDVSPASLAVVRNALEQVVMHTEGTGKRARVGDIRVAGKTGTAENSTGEDHAVFACYAPAEDPQIVVAVFSEQSGHGGAVAAPAAQKVLEAFLMQSGRETARSEFFGRGAESAPTVLRFESEDSR